MNLEGRIRRKETISDEKCHEQIKITNDFTENSAKFHAPTKSKIQMLFYYLLQYFLKQLFYGELYKKKPYLLWVDGEPIWLLKSFQLLDLTWICKIPLSYSLSLPPYFWDHIGDSIPIFHTGWNFHLDGGLVGSDLYPAPHGLMCWNLGNSLRLQMASCYSILKKKKYTYQSVLVYKTTPGGHNQSTIFRKNTTLCFDIQL